MHPPRNRRGLLPEWGIPRAGVRGGGCLARSCQLRNLGGSVGPATRAEDQRELDVAIDKGGIVQLVGGVSQERRRQQPGTLTTTCSPPTFEGFAA